MQVLWSRKIAAPPRGLALARERGWLLVWDAERGLHLLDGSGQPQAHIRTPDGVTDACCADDGQTFAALGAGGRVWLLAPDLTPRWERTLPQRGTAVSLDPFGQYLAAADAGGGLSLFDLKGRSCWRVACPRPLRHLAFIPEKPSLAASADFGLVCCFDLSGNLRWRDGPMAHVGALTVNGDGTAVALACFSDGLICYSLEGPKSRRLDAAGACRLACASFDGDAFLTADLGRHFHWTDAAGSARGDWSADCAPIALALGATGEDAFVALADGRLVAWRIA